ncbi:DUF2512 family protein [Ammoniphilus resinae]|uniref:DUF2512 family protein n=1 Tax=Ammoniphilus resinae TaxID=861532 RepID=A0ABS4GIW0_9BACL|nr:DUF2512 family protein [Ammoniphilus resinae]MBP1930198.1 hypothetical protein [Ammoniphilus resinae]
MSLARRVGINLAYKIIYFPLILFLLPQLFLDHVVYSSWVVPFTLSALYIAIGLIADETVLPKFGLVSSTIQGCVFMIVVTWLSQFVFNGTVISIFAAIVIGLLLGIGEYLMHQRILAWRRTEMLSSP